MYSVVLMMALSGGTQAVDCSCAGPCSGTVVMSSCSCSGGGHGHRLFGGGHGCCGGGGMFSGHGCCGGGGGLFSGHGHSACCGGGGLFSGMHGRRACCGGGGHGHARSACCGGGGLFSMFHRGQGCCGGYSTCSGYAGCTGGYSACTGGVGCAGGVMVAPGTTTVAPTTTPEPVKVLPKVEKKEEARTTAPATIIVSLPAKATLTVDGNATKSTSATRTLLTPALEVGNSYAYSLRAELDGQVITQQITVRGGETTQAEFSFPVQGVASR